MTDRLLSFDYYLIERRQVWLRPLIVVGVLLLSAGLALQTDSRVLTLALLALGAAGVAVIFMHWPSLGIIITAVTGLTVPTIGPSGFNITMVLLAVLLGLWVLEMLVRDREVRLVSPSTTRPLLLLIVASVLSFGVGQLLWFTFAEQAPLGAQLAGMSIFVLSAGGFLLVANRIRDLRWLKTLTFTILAFGAAVVLLRIGQLELKLGVRFLQPPGVVFWTWLVALAFSQALLNHELKLGWRLALGVLVLGALHILFIRGYADKSGWIGAFVCIAVIIAARSWRVGLALAVIGAFPASFLLMDAAASDAYSLSTRLDALAVMAEIVKVNPLFGLGFANYYYYTPLFPIRGWFVQFNSHNNYADIVAQTGVVGLVCFLWFFWEVGRLGWRLRQRVSGGFAKAYVHGALGALVAMLVVAMLADWVLPFFYNIGLYGFRSAVIGWLLLGGVVSLAQIVSQEPEVRSEV